MIQIAVYLIYQHLVAPLVHPVPPGDGRCDTVLQLFGRQYCMLLLAAGYEMWCIRSHTVCIVYFVRHPP